MLDQGGRERAEERGERRVGRQGGGGKKGRRRRVGGVEEKKVPMTVSGPGATVNINFPSAYKDVISSGWYWNV